MTAYFCGIFGLMTILSGFGLLKGIKRPQAIAILLGSVYALFYLNGVSYWPFTCVAALIFLVFTAANIFSLAFPKEEIGAPHWVTGFMVIPAQAYILSEFSKSLLAN